MLDTCYGLGRAEREGKQVARVSEKNLNRSGGHYFNFIKICRQNFIYVYLGINLCISFIFVFFSALLLFFVLSGFFGSFDVFSVVFPLRSLSPGFFYFLFRAALSHTIKLNATLC